MRNVQCTNTHDSKYSVKHYIILINHYTFCTTHVILKLTNCRTTIWPLICKTWGAILSYDNLATSNISKMAKLSYDNLAAHMCHDHTSKVTDVEVSAFSECFLFLYFFLLLHLWSMIPEK